MNLMGFKGLKTSQIFMSGMMGMGFRMIMYQSISGNTDARKKQYLIRALPDEFIMASLDKVDISAFLLHLL